MPHLDWRWWLPIAGIGIGFVAALLLAPPLIVPVLLFALAFGLGALGAALYRSNEGRAVRLLGAVLMAAGLFSFIGSALTFMTIAVGHDGEVQQGSGPPGLPPDSRSSERSGG